MQINESRLKNHVQRVELVEGLSKSFMDCIDGESKHVKVGNLSFDDLQKVLDEVAVSEALKTKSIDEMKSLASKSIVVDAVVSIFETIKENYDRLSSETIRKISLLKYGVIEPKISHTNAVLIAKNFSIDFKMITDRILLLSQMGAIPLGESEKHTKDTPDG